MMLDQNGIEMIAELKNTHPEVKVIAISGGTDWSALAKRLGAKYAIKKLFTVDQIRGAVNDMLAIQ